MINKTDGLRKEFDLDVISLKEDSLEKVNSELSGACWLLGEISNVLIFTVLIIPLWLQSVLHCCLVVLIVPFAGLWKIRIKIRAVIYASLTIVFLLGFEAQRFIKMLSLYNFCKTITGNNRLNKVWKKVCTLAAWENKAPLIHLFTCCPLSPFPLKWISCWRKSEIIP